MRRMSSRVLAVGLAAGLPWLASAARADAANGERLARQWCAACHVVNGGGPSAPLPQGPPSFRTAAGHLGPEQTRAFLARPHGQMPDLNLTRAEIDDLVAYIATLR